MRASRRIGLIGCGQWGRHILRDLVSLGCRVTVVARSDASRRRAREGGADSIVPSLAELPVIDGAVVAVPSHEHAATVLRLLERAMPIFVEKPLATDPVDAARIVEAGGDRVFVMHKWRYHPGVQALAEIARSETIGPIAGLHCTRIQWGQDHRDVDALWLLAPHDLSIALEILGRLPEPTAAVADGPPGEPVGLNVQCAGDPWLVLELSTRSPVRRREIRLRGRDGSALLADAYSDHVEIRRARPGRDVEESEPERRPIPRDMPLLRELGAFVEHLGGGPPPKSSAAEGLGIVRCICAIRSLAGLDGGPS